jgi:hypothetical protein
MFNFFFTPGKGINILKKLTPVLTMRVLKILRTAYYPLLVLTNWAFLLFFKIKN